MLADILPILQPYRLLATADNSTRIYLVNRYGEITPPCLVPFPAVKALDLTLFHKNALKTFAAGALTEIDQPCEPRSRM